MDNREFGLRVHYLIQGKALSREEIKDMFVDVLQDIQPQLQQGAFLAALTAKGETPEEIAGAWEAIYEIDTVKVSPQVSSPLMENCGTGIDELETFNVSTGAALIAAANGIPMVRHGARAITSCCGTVDLLEELGINVDCNHEVVQQSIEWCSIGIFNGMSAYVHPQGGLGRILSQIRFGTVLNIAASLANPALPSCAVRGVYSLDKVRLVAEVMKEIGYRRAYVVYGFNNDKSKGMDELSTLGETIVNELRPDGTIGEHSFYPEDVGIERAREEDIMPAGNIVAEAGTFRKLIAGKLPGARRDILCLNAAAILYLSGKVKDIRAGIVLAGDTLEAGKAINKLYEWKEVQKQ